MPFAILFLSLLGCKEPPVLDPLTEALAGQVLTVAEPQVRLFVGVAAVVGESCVTDSMTSYRFSGAAAVALGVRSASVITSESGDHTWTFSDVGLDGTGGDLVLSTDSERTSFSATYTADDNTLMSGEFHILTCSANLAASRAFAGDTADTADTAAETGDTAGSDTGATESGSPEDYTVNVSGNFDVTTATGTDHMSISGDAPYSAFTWAPMSAVAPASGWVHWQDAVDDGNVENQLTLQGAENIDYTARTWPGQASSARWSRAITIPLL